LRARASGIVAESMIAQAKREGGGVRMALIEIRGKPLKEAEAELIAYYVEMGVRDPEVIAAGIRAAFVPGISKIGHGFVSAHWNGAAGGGQRLAIDFEAGVEGLTHGTLSRARIAVESQRQKDLTYFDQIVR